MIFQPLLLLTVLAAPQDGEPAAAPAAAPAASDESGAPSADAEALRSRIHEMRMNLLLGGDRVKAAEREAIDFYSQKSELVEQRLDSLEADLSEKRAAYDVAVDRALNSQGSARSKALQEANQLHNEVLGLEAERESLGVKRRNLGRLVTSVEARERDRQRLVAQLETSSDFELDAGLPMAGIGLAPDVPAEASSSPLANEGFVEDLLKRNPSQARTLLFEENPAAYWQRFPLQPPRGPLGSALEFPLPDLPGRR